MAHVLIVAPAFSNSPRRHRTLQLIQNLTESQHKIRILTSHSADFYLEDLPKNVDYFHPFRKWGYLETSHLIKCLHGFSADIVHFILEPESKKSYRLLPLIPSILEVQKRTRCVVQFLGPKHRFKNLSEKWIFQLSDAVVTDSHFAKLQLSSEDSLLKNPVFYQLGAQFNSKELPNHSHWVHDEFRKYIYIPTKITSTKTAITITQNFMSYLQENPQHAVVVNISSLNFLNRWLRTHELKKLKVEGQIVGISEPEESEHFALMKNASAISSCHLNSLDHRLADLSHETAQLQKIHIVPNGFLESEKPFSHCLTLKSFLTSPNSQKTQFPQREIENFHFENQLSRIYSDLLQK